MHNNMLILLLSVANNNSLLVHNLALLHAVTVVKITKITLLLIIVNSHETGSIQLREPIIGKHNPSVL